MSFEITTYGNTDADTFLLQMVDDHDLEFIESEISHIRNLTGGQDFCLKAVKVGSWNHDLSPWPAPPVFGKEGFGDGAVQTLQFLEENALTDSARGAAQSPQRVFIGGYSLAGLFALWAGYQTDRFDGIAAASPSIWFPDFTEYMRENRMLPLCSIQTSSYSQPFPASNVQITRPPWMRYMRLLPSPM